MDARQVGHVTRRAFGGDPMQGRLNNGIRLCMDGPDAMSIDEQMADLITVSLPHRRTIEACC